MRNEKLINEAERLLSSGKFQEALGIFLGLLKVRFCEDRCFLGVGLCLLKSDPVRAASFFGKVSASSKLYPVAIFHRGLCESLCGDERASETLLEALRVAPESLRGRVHVALGTLFQKLFRDDEAIVHLELALKFGGVDVEGTSLDLAYARMRSGKFDERSWFLHESRWRRVPSVLNPPAFYGDPAGKTVLVVAEQGMGDNIQFARYLPVLRERAGRVILVTHDVLKGIFKHLADEVVGFGESHSAYDLHMSIMSLPYFLDIGSDIARYNSPYIFADDRWASRLPSGRKVGVVWSGGIRVGGNEEIRLKMERRNIDAELLLSAIPDDFQIVSLQLPSAGVSGVCDIMGLVKDYADTAGIIQHLDFVVGVDTSVIHLAGAMGKKTFMLSRRDACWRWGKEDYTPWYPTMRIFRQDSVGDWDVPLEMLRDALASEI